MPIPTPEKDETKVDFMERCMSDSYMSEEYGDEDARTEACTISFNEATTEEEAPEKVEKEDDVEAAVPTPEDDEEKEVFMERCMGLDYDEEACTISWDKSQEKEDESEDETEEIPIEAKDVFIYDMIGAGGVNAKMIVDELGSIGSKTPINLRINSAGGDVFEGIAIYNSLKKHEGNISVEIEGLAASMASIIMLAGDNISASENSLIMIHNPSIGIQGEAKDLNKKAELLDKIKTQMVGIYTSKTGMNEKEVIKMMDNETWLSAEEAKDKKFIDSVGASIKVAANSKLEIFATAPDWVKETINNPNKSVMDSIVDTLTNLKDKITGFKKELPKGVNILDESAIKNELVNLSQEISDLSSVNDELSETLSIVATQESEILNLRIQNKIKQSEINKMNAKPTKVKSDKDPVISLSTKIKESSGWDLVANDLKK
ncbi:MAG: putative capsid assembly protease C [Prokaryotic dsDNA virus sp.]|nr:MAG: putative capsid assembly protease C [Prokaryotic dsDNA virus sp.]|tara:strand:+ start:32948 stop:34243 length:1296 start_codon:yes stop_codon:yes gene_type:complete